MQRILVDVLRGLVDIVLPPKRKVEKPKLCQCQKCGQVHFRAVVE